MSALKIHVFNECTPKIKIDKRRLVQIANQVSIDFNRPIGWINFINLPSGKHTEMNAEYLNHDYPTDVITFDLSDSLLTIGEIYTNNEVVIENAIEHGATAEDEFSRMFVHGLLHLMGMNDHSEADRKEMALKENHYLNSFM